MTADLFSSLLISGADARAFLQGQLTCDIDTLTHEKPLLASVNSAQGRVQAVLKVSERNDGIELRVASEMAEKTAQRLRKYVLRSKVKIESTRSSASDWNAPLLTHLRAGIPHVFPATHEAFVAQTLNLDILGGVSFDKGCYTGQEIIARTHFRGAVKRRMFRYAATCLPPLPATRVLSANGHAGDVVYAAATEQGCELLAVVSLSQAETKLILDTGSNPMLTRLDLPYSQQLQIAERE